MVHIDASGLAKLFDELYASSPVMDFYQTGCLAPGGSAPKGERPDDLPFALDGDAYRLRGHLKIRRKTLPFRTVGGPVHDFIVEIRVVALAPDSEEPLASMTDKTGASNEVEFRRDARIVFIEAARRCVKKVADSPRHRACADAREIAKAAPGPAEPSKADRPRL